VAPHGLLLIDFIDFRVFARKCGLNHAIKIDHPNYFTPETALLLLYMTGFEPIHTTISEDTRHIAFLCRPVPMLPDARISESVVKALLDEFAGGA
jgi:hypothetical protein